MGRLNNVGGSQSSLSLDGRGRGEGAKKRRYPSPEFILSFHEGAQDDMAWRIWLRRFGMVWRTVQKRPSVVLSETKDLVFFHSERVGEIATVVVSAWPRHLLRNDILSEILNVSRNIL